MSNMTESYSPDNPWIAERETILCMWKPDYIRGFINNMNMNMAVDVYGFSRRQLREYVRMLKSFGFTGMQVTDGCSNWRPLGGYESIHDRYKDLAEILHEEGMKFTVWVWAAMFNGHGWYDDSARYCAREGMTAWEDPDVRATFEKYYDIYADLAPYADRLVMHFFDPGYLGDYDDVFAYARLLESKFKAVNPGIQFCIDTWGCPPDYPQRLVNAGFGDYMLMELPFLPNWSEPGKRAAFRQGVKDVGCKLGVWSWYTCEYEIDQVAAMAVNSRVTKNVYQRTREQGDAVSVPSYWSEMDSYHVMNLFSLYCAGQLLINPARDPDELLSEIALKVYGEKWHADALEVLELIRDARSGDTWESYWTEDIQALSMCGHEPEEILPRAERALEKIKRIAADKSIRASIPLPLTPAMIAGLTVPHVDQIARYAKFLTDFKKLKAQYEAGADKSALSEALESIYQPVPDFNCIIGVWGQREARYQIAIVRAFCNQAGIPVPERPLHRWLMKKRFYEYLVARYRDNGGSNLFNGNYYEVVHPFGDEEEEILHELEKEGLISIAHDGNVFLLDADAYRYDICTVDESLLKKQNPRT